VTKISAYIPCFNNQETIASVIASVRVQVPPVDELFVLDDGSGDGSAALAESLGVEVVRHPENCGRGAARARAMQRARGEFVLSVDATNVLESDFLGRAMLWFDDPNVAAVYGRIVESRNRTAVERWRGRHLFKNNLRSDVLRGASLITYGTVVRRSAVEAAGGYDSALRHTEDAELGERLLKSGVDVVFDPRLQIRSVANNSLFQVLERYWRWHVGLEGATPLRRFVSHVAYSVKVMAREDLKQGDWVAAGISLLTPHYALLRALATAK